jgi:hypothetical protein
VRATDALACAVVASFVQAEKRALVQQRDHDIAQQVCLKSDDIFGRHPPWITG